MRAVNFGSVLMSVGAVAMLIGGAQGLWRGELRPRRAWGEFGGPKELRPLRGRAAVAVSLWLIAAGVGVLVWAWRA